jgi:hypothetical protein
MLPMRKLRLGNWNIVNACNLESHSVRMWDSLRLVISHCAPCFVRLVHQNKIAPRWANVRAVANVSVCSSVSEYSREWCEWAWFCGVE